MTAAVARNLLVDCALDLPNRAADILALSWRLGSSVAFLQALLPFNLLLVQM